jgi:uncharacterized membrane protein YeaQ/YmgE (transglycosylase-associated protein family)
MLSFAGHRDLAAHVLHDLQFQNLRHLMPGTGRSIVGRGSGTFSDTAGENIMAMFAQIYLDPGGLIAWVIVGLIAGCLAGRVMRGSGYGLVGDIVVGLVGALIGGCLFGTLVTGDYGFLGSIFVAFLGACLLIWIVRQIAPGRSYV